MTPDEIKKLPAHLQPWPDHWAPKEEYLAAISTPTHFYQVLKKIGDEKNTAGAALKRLVATGEATRNERNFYCVSDGEAEAEPAGDFEVMPRADLAAVRVALVARGWGDENWGRLLDVLASSRIYDPEPADSDDLPE